MSILYSLILAVHMNGINHEFVIATNLAKSDCEYYEQQHSNPAVWCKEQTR